MVEIRIVNKQAQAGGADGFGISIVKHDTRAGKKILRQEELRRRIFQGVVSPCHHLSVTTIPNLTIIILTLFRGLWEKNGKETSSTVVKAPFQYKLQKHSQGLRV